MKTLTGIRPSLWARCPSAAVFQGRGEPEAVLPPETEHYFFRGRVFEEIVVRQLAAKHGRDNIEREVEIPIPGIGTGHADFYLRSEKTLGEIKSTVAPHPNSDIFSSGVKQLRIYLAHHPEAEQGALMMINPNVMKAADVYTVKLTDEDREQIEVERQYIEDSVHGDESRLAERGRDWRPCTVPSQARGRMCPFAAVCFEGWEPEPADEITDPLAMDAAGRLLAIKTEKSQHARAIKALEEGEQAAQAELSDLVGVGDSVVGPFKVKRTHVVRKPTFSVRAFEAAGHSVEPLAEFFQPGSEYDTWRVALADEAGDVDYGTAPF